MLQWNTFQSPRLPRQLPLPSRMPCDLCRQYFVSTHHHSSLLSYQLYYYKVTNIIPLLFSLFSFLFSLFSYFLFVIVLSREDIHTLDDWRDVPIFLVRELSSQLPPQVSWIFKTYHNMRQLLVAAYPDHKVGLSSISLPRFAIYDIYHSFIFSSGTRSGRIPCEGYDRSSWSEWCELYSLDQKSNGTNEIYNWCPKMAFHLK